MNATVEFGGKGIHTGSSVGREGVLCTTGSIPKEYSLLKNFDGSVVVDGGRLGFRLGFFPSNTGRAL